MSIVKLRIDDEYATITRTETVFDAAKLMKKANLPDLVVIDEEHHIEGIVTDFDIVTKVVAKSKNPNDTLIVEIMTVVRPISLSTSIKTALKIMRRKQLPFVPVADEHEKLVGVVTIQDVWSVMAKEDLDESEADQNAESSSSSPKEAK